MSTSRRFEVQKKKLAVRRLSHGTRQSLPSPQGDGKFKFKAKRSPEEYAERKRKLQQKLGTLKGNANPMKWVRGDLRNKLASRDKIDEPNQSSNQRKLPSLMGEESSFTFQRNRKERTNEQNENIGQRNLPSLMGKETPFDFQSNPKPVALPKPLLPGLNESSEKDGVINPFAVALQGEQLTQKPLFSKPVSDITPASTEEKPRLFGKEKQDEKAMPFKMKDDNISLFTAKVDFGGVKPVDQNPFLVRKKDDITSSSQLKPASQEFSVVPAVHPRIVPPAASASFDKNPFASALQSFSQVPAAQPNIFSQAKTGGILPKEEKPEEEDKQNTSPVFSKDAHLIAELTSLKLIGIPDELNNKEFLRSFYSRFGELKRVYSHTFTKSAIITFFKHEPAAEAKKNGTMLKRGGQPIAIFWCKGKSSKAKSGDDDQSMQEAPKIDEKPKEKDSKADKNSLSSRKNSIVSMITIYANTLKKVPAIDSNEKAELLEKLDQKIREGMKKETDINKASLVIGTCPDMCPEKERYLREHRQRLAVYEVQSGTETADTMSGQYPVADPCKTIKEYSRSSADQEEPLAHELRPGHVLQLTMNYLMLNVMDAGDKNWADWYDFVWNRTRAIRKDITQQHLSDESSVDLLEKCARFHIFCSHHLCEENINAFDPKINNENLTKCLQSLKHMYEDLYIHKGVACSNEAEFRCYQILLNLNNGDILREVTEFRPEVRESHDVRFALEVFKALNSTNYVRFFKLLHEGSYLMACIMQSYFNQIRSKGLFIMNKAYSSKVNKPSPVPLTDIARLFAIDELDEASEFCEHYGFPLDNNMVYFSKSSYEEPESSFPPVRNGIIERKRTCSFGEVVNGKTLPLQLEYTPTNSFDKNGYYNGAYHEIAVKGILRDNESASDEKETQPEMLPVEPSNQPEDDDLKAVCVGLLKPIVNQEVYEVTTKTMNEVKEAVLAATEATIDILDTTVRNELKTSIEDNIKELGYEMITENIYDGLFETVAMEQIKAVVEEEWAMEKSKIDHEKRMKIFQLATGFSQEFLLENVSQNLKEIASEALRLEKQERLTKVIAEESAELSRKMFSNVLEREITEICKNCLLSEIRLRKENLEKIKQKVLTLRTRRLFKRWLRERNARKHIWETLNNFPACSPLQVSSDIIRSLTLNREHASNVPECVKLQNNVELAISSVSNLARKRDRHRDAVEKFHQQLISERRELTMSLSPQPIVELMSKSLLKRGDRCFFSKLLLNLPNPTGRSYPSGIDLDVIRGKFQMNGENELTQQDGVPHIENLCLVNESSPNGYISFCVKAISGAFKSKEDMIRESKDLYGVSGIIFVLDFNLAQSWSAECERLKNVLLLMPSVPCCPLLVIGVNYPSSYSSEQVITSLGLNALKSHGQILDYYVLLFEPEVDGACFNEELTAGLLKLVQKTPNFPKMQTSKLLNLIEDALRLNFFDIIYEDRVLRKTAEIPEMETSAIVDLHNNVIDHVSQICTSEKLMDISWPSREMAALLKDVPDLFWNDQLILKQLGNLLNRIKLPFLPSGVDPDGDWSEQQQLCLEYLYSILNLSTQNMHPSELISRVERIVNQYIHKWKYREGVLQFPWSLILEECIAVVLTSIHEPHSDANFSRTVCFFKEEFYKFKPMSSVISKTKYSNRSVLSERALSSLQELNTSSRDEYIQRSIVDVDQSLTLIEQSMSLSKESLDISGSHSPLDDLIRRQRLLDESLSSERLALTRLSDACVGYVKDLSPTSTPPASRVKRKRAVENAPEAYKKNPVTDPVEKMNVELKRPKKSIESKIDDLLAEVQFLRSNFKLDQRRYDEAVGS